MGVGVLHGPGFRAEVPTMSEVVAQVKSCGGDWCRVQVGPHVGWVERTQVWGVYKGENVN